jgi:hypothetical protein
MDPTFRWSVQRTLSWQGITRYHWVPANLGCVEKTEILLLFLRMAYFKPIFQVLRGIVSFPVRLVFYGQLVTQNFMYEKCQKIKEQRFTRYTKRSLDLFHRYEPFKNLLNPWMLNPRVMSIIKNFTTRMQSYKRNFVLKS